MDRGPAAAQGDLLVHLGVEGWEGVGVIKGAEGGAKAASGQAAP